MLEYKKALDLILSETSTLPAENVELSGALHRVLTEDVVSDTDMPPFNKSAMDGYACRKSELGNELEVVEILYAGKKPEKQISVNQCYKIMTGAMVPAQADFVFKKEDSRQVGENRVICTRQSHTSNICFAGEDIRKGDRLLHKQTLIRPRHLPVLAGAGVFRPSVYKLPVVGVFATGTELVEPYTVPLPHQIRNSNSSQLCGQLSEMKIDPHYGGIIPDEEEILTHVLQQAVESNDVTLLTGGVSVGDLDLVPVILERLGMDILVTSTAIKPGKPVVFAKKGCRYVFGLSGNPVSAFVQFELYVKAFLYKLSGYDYRPGILTLPFGSDFDREYAGRTNFVPVVINSDMEVVPVEFHGSAHISALSHADYLMEIPAGIHSIRKGELVHVRPV